MRSLALVLLALFPFTLHAKPEVPTYRDVLGESGVRRIVRQELRRLPGRYKDLRVVVKPGMEDWAVKRILPLHPNSDGRQAVESELQRGHEAFLNALVEFQQSVDGGTVVEISPGGGDIFLKKEVCGKVPCSGGCCDWCRICMQPLP